MRGRPPFPITSAIALWYQGVDCDEIAKRLGRIKNGERVAVHLRRAGIPVPRRAQVEGHRAGPRGPAAARSEEEMAEIVALHDVGGLSFAALAEHLGVSRTRAHQLYKQAKRP